MWYEEFKIKNNLAEISQKLTFPHFPFFEIFAHIYISISYFHCFPKINIICKLPSACISLALEGALEAFCAVSCLKLSSICTICICICIWRGHRRHPVLLFVWNYHWVETNFLISSEIKLTFISLISWFYPVKTIFTSF